MDKIKQAIQWLKDEYEKKNPRTIELGKKKGKEAVASAKEISKPSPEPTVEELIQAIVGGSNGDPVATMAAQMVNTGKTMPVFQQNPFLPVAISQLESRGFKDFGVNPLVTQPKQGFGWAPGIQGYNPPIERVLQDMMSAVGTDRSGETNPVRLRNAGYYQKFRDNPSDIAGFAQQYAGPVTAQNPNAGGIYASNLSTVMNRYAEVLNKILQKRGSSYTKRY